MTNDRAPRFECLDCLKNYGPAAENDPTPTLVCACGGPVMVVRLYGSAVIYDATGPKPRPGLPLYARKEDN